jgi:hypothetical protein
MPDWQQANYCPNKTISPSNNAATLHQRGDSAVADHFFLNFKIERIWQREYANHAQTKTNITTCIVGPHNCVRPHSVLGTLSPTVFERNMTRKNPIVVPKIT